MTASTLLRTAPLALLLSGCLIPVTPRLGYTRLEVERPVFEEPGSNLPLAFVLDGRIRDAFLSEREGD